MKRYTLLVKNILIGTPWRKRITCALTGAVGGFAYYYFVGCRSGTCPITSNPWVSTLYGAVIGLVMTIGERKNTPS